jgi:outer membrane protein OmpA-like peptidoglycan-associated protein
MKQLKKYAWLLLGFCILLPAGAEAQNNVGLPFLKIGTGARQAGMAEVFTGVADDIYAMYWNPGGLGHVRRWQWSATYTRWFADVYHAGITYVQQFRMLGSHKTSIGISCNYLGMPEWDSTGGEKEAVSAGHLMGSLAIAQRLDWISRALALGVNFKAVSSRLDTYSSVYGAADFGLFLRPGRFSLGKAGMGVFEYGFVSAGVCLQHFGSTVTFDREITQLPETWRAGLSLRMGKYGGWNWLVAADAVRVRGRDWRIGMGTELWWRDIVGGRMGYELKDKDLGGFTFGFSVRWDDVLSSLLGLPTRFGDAFELDVADVGYGDVLKQTYRGTLAHYPVAPEPFKLDDPHVVDSQIRGKASAVNLTWEKSIDPDPFDRVAYLIFIDKDKAKVERTIRWVEKDMESFMLSDFKDSLMVCELIPGTEYRTQVLEGGIYYWAVAAYDLGYHARLAKRGRERVAEFIVATADLHVREFTFNPIPWITTSPEQGTLFFVIANSGNAPSEEFRFVASDLYYGQSGSSRKPLINAVIRPLEVGQDTTLRVAWSTYLNGTHTVTWVVDPDTAVLELNRENNKDSAPVVSIPKGMVLVPDTMEVMATGFDSTDIPIVPEIYFETNSAELNPFYYTDQNGMPSVLGIMARRIKSKSDIVVKIKGSIDELSGEERIKLADERAEAVQARLNRMGLDPGQIRIIRSHSEKILGRRPMPADSMDARYVMEQNRVVTFEVDRDFEETVFGPMKVAVDTTIRRGIPFSPQILSPGDIFGWRIEGKVSPFRLDDQRLVQGDSLWGIIFWDATDMEGIIVPRNNWYAFTLELTDTLGRSFSTRPDSIYIREKQTLRRREVFGAAKFAQVEPVYQFYWDRLMDVAHELVKKPNMRLRFEGHACVIGSDEVNERLSRQRAERFSQAFLNRLRQAYPDIYEEVRRRVETPVGFGEKEPLTVRIKGKGHVLLGDNDNPVGRYLNRRIMVLLYSEN